MYKIWGNHTFIFFFIFCVGESDTGLECKKLKGGGSFRPFAAL